MSHQGRIGAVLLIACSFLGYWGCGDAQLIAPTPATMTVNCSTTALAAVGQQSICAASFALSNGNTQDQTGAALWRSSNPAIATVTAGGHVSAVAPGTADISATYQNVSGMRTVTVSQPPTATLSVRLSSSALVAIQDVTEVTFTMGAGTSDLTYVMTYGDGGRDTTPSQAGSGAGGHFTHVYHATGTFAAQLTVTNQAGQQAQASANVTVKNLGGVWDNLITNSNNFRTESRHFSLVQGPNGALTGSYTHPEGNSEPIVGTVDSSGSVQLALTPPSTLKFAGMASDGNGVIGDASSMTLIVIGGTADGLSLTFTRE